MRRVPLIIVTLYLLLALPAEAGAKFHYTHRVTVRATLTDNWTLNDANPCGPRGDGSVSLNLVTKASTRIRPFVSREFAQHEGNKAGPVWILGVPAGAGAAPMGPRRVKGTITTVDNTVPGPPKYEEFPCTPIDKTQCGTKTVTGSHVQVAGYAGRNLYGTVFISGGFTYQSACQHGALNSWREPDDITPGINKDGEMLIKMPSLRSVKRHKKTVVTGTDHRSTTYFNDSTLQTFTDKITRTITVTIEKL